MRDDFTERTKELLAKRTGYRCSNPDCKKPTVGSNTNKEKSTSIGVAAHITAASPGGPRYNSSLTVDQRSDMDNGIWLCQSCSTLIDKDPDKFTVSLLNKWRTEAEDESFNELMKNYPQALKENKPPILEAEITWTGTMRRALGLSYKNRDVYKEAIPISLAIWDYSIKWMYEIKISNNSSVPAFNIEIVEEPNANSFTYIERLSKINNIQPYHEIVISANTTNTAMKVYVDQANTGMASYVVASNTAMKAYVDQANTGMASYVVSSNTFLQANDATTLAAAKTYANTIVSANVALYLPLTGGNLTGATNVQSILYVTGRTYAKTNDDSCGQCNRRY